MQLAASTQMIASVLALLCRRLSARIGKAKAVTATARKIAILFYNAMRFGMVYQDPRADHYEQKYRERVVKGCIVGQLSLASRYRLSKVFLRKVRSAPRLGPRLPPKTAN